MVANKKLIVLSILNIPISLFYAEIRADYDIPITFSLRIHFDKLRKVEIMSQRGFDVLYLIVFL